MPARRYYARRYYNKKRKWTRCQQRYVINFPIVNSSKFSTTSFPIFYTYNNNTAGGAAAPNGVTRIKIKNIKVQCNLFDSNAGEFWLLSIVFVPNAGDLALEQLNKDVSQFANLEFTFLNPNNVLAQKKITCNDYDTSSVTLYTRLARWLGPGDSLRVVVTHGTESTTATTNSGGVSFWSSFVITDS